MESKEIVQHLKQITPIKSFLGVLESSSPRLGRINPEHKEKLVAGKLSQLIVAYFSFEKVLNYDQLLLLSGMVNEDYPLLKFGELELIFKKAAKGEYGEIYNRIDINTIFRWIRMYFNESRNYFADLRDREHEERKWGGVIDAKRGSSEPLKIKIPNEKIHQKTK